MSAAWTFADVALQYCASHYRLQGHEGSACCFAFTGPFRYSRSGCGRVDSDFSSRPERGPKTSTFRCGMGYPRWGNEMMLDWRICSRARLSRDPRFDGKFFIGVIGSHVYCRSICPAPTAKEKIVAISRQPLRRRKPAFAPVCDAGPSAHPEPPRGWERQALWRGLRSEERR